MSESLDRRRVEDGRYAGDRRKSRERRKGPDVWLQSLRWFAFVSWVLLIGSFFLISFAKPQTVTFFERVNNLTVRQDWDYHMMSYVLWMLVVALFGSLVGLLVNLTRRRRKQDVFYFSLLASAVVSAVGFFWVLTL